MCGIAGILNFKGTEVTIPEIKHFSEPLNHRGPDGEGFTRYNNNSYAFAHKRLSILDLSEQGAQPMASDCGSLSITYNGEVYNFIELKEQLIQKGYQFKTQTDTEVILNAFKHWGTSCFEKFNGMWAIAIHNKDSNEVLLCRDRFGIKPLYFKHFGSFFAFASETNSFKNIKGHPRSFNIEVLSKSLEDPYYAGSIHSSIFEGIEQLKPGHFMKISPDGTCNQERYYHFEAICAEKSHIEYKEGDFKELFFDAVQLRLRSDVPIATAFSGGLDSTAVFSTVKHLASTQSNMSRLPSNWQSAFCMAMEEDEKLNDLPYALEALKELEVEGNIIRTDFNNLAKNIIRDTTYFDDIIGTPLTSISSIYKSMKENGYTVSLDGHGADEYLFGYRNMVMELFYKSTQYKGKKYAKRVKDCLVKMYTPSEQIAKESQLQKSIRSSYGGVNYFKRIIRNTFTPYEPNRAIVLQNFFSNPLPSLLKNFDKASMLHGVEIRMPFMDHRLVEMGFNLENSQKINEGKSKWIIRNELKDIMPKSALNRTYKIGVGAPVEIWLEKVFSKNDKLLDSKNLNIEEIKPLVKNKWQLLNLNAIEL